MKNIVDEIWFNEKKKKKKWKAENELWNKNNLVQLNFDGKIKWRELKIFSIILYFTKEKC